MRVGTITKLYRDQEYGMIRSQNGEEAHFHKLCLWDIEFKDLAEGQRVEFEVQGSYKGSLAFHIRPYVPSDFSEDEAPEGVAHVQRNDKRL